MQKKISAKEETVSVLKDHLPPLVLVLKGAYCFKYKKFSEVNEKMQSIINKCFIAQTTAVKFQLTQDKDEIKAFMHVGRKNEDKWDWEKSKLHDGELAEILLVLEGKKEGVNFFHKFNGDSKQIYVNRDKRDGKAVWFKIQKLQKPLIPPEQRVLKVLLEWMIMRKNMVM